MKFNEGLCHLHFNHDEMILSETHFSPGYKMSQTLLITPADNEPHKHICNDAFAHFGSPACLLFPAG